MLQLGAVDSTTAAPVTRFGTLLAIHVGSPGTGVVVAYSSDGLTWTPVDAWARPPSASARRPDTSPSPTAPWTSTRSSRAPSRSSTTLPPPTTPGSLRGRFSQRALLLTWTKATDNSGAIATYRILLNGAPIQTLAATSTKTSVTRFRKTGWSVYRVIAVDGSGNQSARTNPIAVVKKARPRGLPRAIPAWAWRLLKWQSHGKKGKRPLSPRPVPSWYWRWAGWQLTPYRFVG